jgi:hypothetical protein
MRLCTDIFLAQSTKIHPEKVRAYLATEYRIGPASREIILTIGKRSELLAEFFAVTCLECGAFLTAGNPLGKSQSDSVNELAHADLLRLLNDQGVRAIEGWGSAQGSDWPPERSWFAMGLQLGPAKTLGRCFDQDAIVWVGINAVPELILLR